MFRQWNIKSHSCSRVQVPSMLFPKPFVNVQVSLSFKNTDSTNARNVRNFNNFSRDDCQILFCLLQDFHAKAFLTFTSFSVVSINAPNYLKLSTFLMFSFLTDFKTVSCSWLKPINSVFSAFWCKPIFAALCSKWCKEPCACSIFSVTSVMSSDHKIIHDDLIEYHEKQNVTFITTSTTTNANNAQSGGLGLLINRISSAALVEIKPYNSQIIVASLKGIQQLLSLHTMYLQKVLLKW